MPDDGDGRPLDGDGKPLDGDGNPAEGDGIPDDGDGSPEDGDGSPEDGDGIPPDGDGKPPDGEGIPPDGEGIPPDDDGEGIEDWLAQAARPLTAPMTRIDLISLMSSVRISHLVWRRTARGNRSRAGISLSGASAARSSPRLGLRRSRARGGSIDAAGQTRRVVDLLRRATRSC